MSILIDASKRVLIQGITGREGQTRTRLMKDYGTQVVAGITPGRGGERVEDVPVFDTVVEACEKTGMADVSVIFVPAPLVKNAALEAIDAGIKLLVLVPDRVPIYDVLEIADAARLANAHFIGPNTLGILSPGKAVLGMMGGQAASAREWFFDGPVGVTSRSGGMTSSTAYYLAKAGIGASTLVHVGGDAVVGMPHAEILKMFERDNQTRVVVMFGEIGTSQEEEAADLIRSSGFNKPLIAFIGGKAAKSGTRFSHAGAIIEGGRGTHEAKVSRLREAGAYIAESFADLPRLTQLILDKLPTTHPVGKPSPKGDKREDFHWATAITSIQPNEIRLRGYRLDELMGEITFSQAIYLALTGNLPSPKVGELLDAIFVASIDHGVTPPSTLAALTAASTGAPFNAAIATGILSINQHHGGAIEDSMRLVLSALETKEQSGQSFEDIAMGVVASFQAQGKRLPGFGHRVHTADPRTTRLLAMADDLQISANGIHMQRAIQASVAIRSGRKLPINVDGAIAALLIDLDLPPELANTFFMIARVPGLVAHIHEEKTRQRPMRVIDPIDHTYDGPEPRQIIANSDG
jgi:succinyl-CoA synthetase alpha subunit